MRWVLDNYFLKEQCPRDKVSKYMNAFFNKKMLGKKSVSRYLLYSVSRWLPDRQKSI